MDIGLLLLRLLVGGLLFGHAAQKMFGWFGGHGPAGTAPIFEMWGLRPGKHLVVFAAVCELVAAVLLILGLFTPFAAAVAVGTMAVASWVNVPKGLWAQGGGYELALTYAGIAAGLGFTGAGTWSLDHRLIGNYPHVMWGTISLAVGLAAATCFIGYALRNRRRVPTAA
ncbi:hypothetical protein AXA44_01405 [Rhodococcus sp. SC4]|nr:hypothetical protein AXA44_01405 [Rhodococcus sp. SC4]